MAYVYRITWPDQSVDHVDGPREAVAIISERYPSARLPKWTVLSHEVNMAAIQPVGGMSSYSIYGEEGYRIEVEIVEDVTDARRLRERQLQEEHGLSVQESVVMAALEAGERVTDIRKRLGVSQQAITDAKRRALIKMGERRPEA
jgi:CRISPR/Cas system-associated endoribonuclease Cas2